MGNAATVSYNSKSHQYSNTVFSNGNLRKTQSLCMQREPTRKAFSKYIKNGNWMSDLAKTQLQRSSLKDRTRLKNHDYLLPDDVNLKVEHTSSPTSVTQSSLFEEPQTARSTELSVDIIRLFLLSAISNLFHCSTNEAPKSLSREEASMMKPSMSSSQYSYSYGGAASLAADPNFPSEMLLMAASHFHIEEHELFLRQNWSNQLTDTLLNFPLAITIYSAEADRGFPLLYANTSWERLTEQSAASSIGKGVWEILTLGSPSADCELESSNAGFLSLDQALREAYSLHVGLPCRRQSGDFFDLVGVAPVHKVSPGATYAGYRSVAMVHCEAKLVGGVYVVAREDLDLAENMLRLLPLVVKY